MKMNRRNALLGLGAIATGGGALFGSGAFSQVQADRAVSLSVTDDTSGLLGLSANNSDIANDSAGSGTELGIAASSLNPDATTRFDNAFDITNNATSGARLVAHDGVSASGAISSIDLYLDGDVGNTVTADPWNAGDYVTLNNGATLTVGIAITTAETGATTENLSLHLEAAESESDFSSSITVGGNLGTETA